MPNSPTPEERLEGMVEAALSFAEEHVGYRTAAFNANLLRAAGVPDLLAQLADFERDFEDFRTAEGDRDDMVCELERAGVERGDDNLDDVVRRVLAERDRYRRALIEGQEAIRQIARDSGQPFITRAAHDAIVDLQQALAPDTPGGGDGA